MTATHLFVLALLNAFLGANCEKLLELFLPSYNASIGTSSNSFTESSADMVDIERVRTYDWNRRMLEIDLKIPIPVNGFPFSKVVITKLGFISLAPFDVVNNKSELVAPLMAAFDTTQGTVLFKKSPHFLEVTWTDMVVEAMPNMGNFSFGVVLFKNGNIRFLYHQIPRDLAALNCTIGIADAYRETLALSLTEEKSDFVYEYQRATITDKSILARISSQTIIYWTPHKTCLDFDNCNDCQSSLLSSGACFWCNAAQKCTSGVDRVSANSECKIHLDSCPSLVKSTTEPPKVRISKEEYFSMKKKLHQQLVIHEHTDNTYYDMSVEKHASQHYWEIMVENVNQLESGQDEIALMMPFQITLLGEKVDPVMVIMRDGFVTFQEDMGSKNWVASFLEYIAPLRANFIFNEAQGSRLLYKHTEAKITIEWSKVFIEHAEISSPFSFQCHIFKDGNVTFVYRELPINLTLLAGNTDQFGMSDTKFGPVMIGLSSQKLMQAKNEREHKLMSVDLALVSGGTVVHFKVKPPCSNYSFCGQCLEASHCQWCSNECVHLGTQSLECEEECSHKKYYKYTIKQDANDIDHLWNDGPNEKPLRGEMVYLLFDFPYFGATFSRMRVHKSTPGVSFQGRLIDKTHKITLGEFPFNNGSCRVTVKESRHFILIKWNGLKLFDSAFTHKFDLGLLLSVTGEISMLFKDSPIHLMDPQDLLQPSLQFSAALRTRDFSYNNEELMNALAISQATPFRLLTETVGNDLFNIEDNTVLKFTPLQTCLDLVTCEECVNFEGPIECFWKYGQCEARELLGQVTNSCESEKPLVPYNASEAMVFENKKAYYSYRIFRPSGTKWRQLEDAYQIDNLERVFGRKLKFQFPFYGHFIESVVMLKEGSLSLGNLRIENMLETQTISAMMVDFETDEKSLMLSDDDGEVATFIWKDFLVKNTRFTFEINLYKDGQIEFIYKSAPSMPHQTEDLLHPVKIGLSDGYLIERRSGMLNHQQLIKYHELDLTSKLKGFLGRKSRSHEVVIAIEPLKTCNQFKSCWECTTHNTNFNCIWCPGLQACSDNGIDRRYQEWANAMCYDSRYSISKLTQCPVKIERSQFAYYNQTVFKSPRVSQSPTKIQTNQHIFAFEHQLAKNDTISAKLPFKFSYFGVEFHEIDISPMGFISFTRGSLGNSSLEAATVIVFLNASEALENVLHCIITYGSSNVDMDDFVIKWNHSYEAVLHQDGRIDINYFSLSKKPTNMNSKVGLFFKALDYSQIERSVKDYSMPFPIRHVAPGLGLYYEPGPSDCASEFSHCSACKENSNSNCYWCHKTSTCIRTYHFCDNSTHTECTTHISEPHEPIKSHKNEDHYIAGLIGICVLITAAVAAMATCFIYGAKNADSLPARILQSCNSYKSNVFWRSSDLTSSQANLTSEEHRGNCDRRASVDTTMTTTL